MLRANATDAAKLEQAMHAVFITAKTQHLAAMESAPIEGVAPELRFIRVDQRDFYRACGFARLRRNDFADEVNDTLSGRDFCEKHGLWVFVNYELDDWLFVCIAPEAVANPLNALEASNVLVRVAHSSEREQIKKPKPAGWFVTPKYVVMEYNPELTSQSLSADGTQVTVTYACGTYTTALHKTRSAAARVANASDVTDS